MMLRPRWHNQSSLLERYLIVLTSRHRATPPADLDPDLATLAEYLTETRQQLQPPAAFVNRLRQDLEASGEVAEFDHTWRRPIIDRRRRATSPATAIGEPGTEDTVMSPFTDLTGDETIQLPRRLTHEWLTIAAAFLAFLIVGSLLVLVLRDEPNDDGNVAGPVATPESTVTLLPVPTEAGLQPTPAVTLPVIEPTIATVPSSDPWSVAVGAGSLWVANNRDGTVSRIDPATNRVVATIAVTQPGNDSAGAIVANDTSVWVVAGILNLVRIDPATNEVVATFPIDQPVDRLAIDGGVVWTQSTDSMNSTSGSLLRRFDPISNTFTASMNIVLPQQTIVAGGAVWVIRDVGRGTDSEILKIDPATATVVTTISLGSYYSHDVQVLGDSLWVPTDSALLRIDMATTQVSGIYPLPEPVNNVPNMTTGDGRIWVCNCTNEPDDVLWQFDIDRLEWSAEIPVGNLEWGSWLAYLDGSIWGYNLEDEVVRIELPE